MFNKKNIDVIRIGLQNTDEISEPGNEQSEVVAGPFHPAFRQLVESSLWYDAIVTKIKKMNAKVKEVEVTVNPANVNNVIGHKKENANKLKELYDVDLIIKQDDKMKLENSKIEITKLYNDFLEK
jgi:transcription antitermination factor NusA-like protein